MEAAAAGDAATAADLARRFSTDNKGLDAGDGCRMAGSRAGCSHVRSLAPLLLVHAARPRPPPQKQPDTHTTTTHPPTLTHTYTHACKHATTTHQPTHVRRSPPAMVIEAARSMDLGRVDSGGGHKAQKAGRAAK